MICAFLLFSGRFSTARDVLDYYASKRTFDSKGVTLPSQRRYVAYFAAKLELGLEYSPTRMRLTAVVLRPRAGISVFLARNPRFIVFFGSQSA